MAIEGLLTIKYFVEGLVKRTHQNLGVLQPQSSFQITAPHRQPLMPTT